MQDGARKKSFLQYDGAFLQSDMFLREKRCEFFVFALTFAVRLFYNKNRERKSAFSDMLDIWVPMKRRRNAKMTAITQSTGNERAGINQSLSKSTWTC